MGCVMGLPKTNGISYYYLSEMEVGGPWRILIEIRCFNVITLLLSSFFLSFVFSIKYIDTYVFLLPVKNIINSIE